MNIIFLFLSQPFSKAANNKVTKRVKYNKKPNNPKLANISTQSLWDTLDVYLAVEL